MDKRLISGSPKVAQRRRQGRLHTDVGDGRLKKNRDIVCLRCGSCCHVDMVAYVYPEDIRRWEEEGRYDIIARLRDGDVIWAGDRIINKFGHKVGTCHYLDWDGSRFFCQIYETRPMVCRNYRPGSSILCPQYDRKALS